MVHLFISHSSTDKPLVALLAARLQDKGYTSFLDFSETHGVIGGTKWEVAIWDEIRRSVAVLLCFTPEVQRSQWAFAEVMIARYEGKLVFPLLFEGSIDDIWEPVRATTQAIDFTHNAEEAYDRLFTALDKLGRVSRADEYWPTNKPPYLGLQSLQKDDAPVFFARRQEVEEVINRLQLRPGGQRAKSLVVVGSSGSGKSSLVRAGILSRLSSGAVPGSENWIYATLTPGNEPFLKLAQAFKRAAPHLSGTRTIEKELQQDEQGLKYVVSDALASRPEGAFFVLFIDQMEELLTRANPEDTKRLFEALAVALGNEEDKESQLILIATLRADFYAAFLSLESRASDLVKNVYPIGLLSLEALREVIEGPARVAGIRLEDGLVERMLEDAETSDALPLLSFILRAMFDSMDEVNRIFTHVAYENLGRLQGALGKHAEQTFSELPSPLGDKLIATILRLFVIFSSDGKSVRRRVRGNEISKDIVVAIDKFINARLLVAGEDEGFSTVEVAHEAIFRNWGRLAEAIAKESATEQYLRQVINQGVSDWRQLNVLLGIEQRRLINEHRENIVLENEQIEMILRSAIKANDDTFYWFKRGRNESNKTWPMIRDILLNADPLSRHHCLELLEGLLEDRDEREVICSIASLVLSSEYPALRRNAQRIVNMCSGIGENHDEYVQLLSESFVLIPSGSCLIGDSDHSLLVDVDGFEISKYLITNLEYAVFVSETGYHAPPHWKNNDIFRGKADHPVVYVSWYDAVEFCKWLSSRTGVLYSLPSEIEWEKAASWNAKSCSRTLYPWGEDFVYGRCNTWEERIGTTTPIGQYSPHNGDSSFGISDMAGNIWQWTNTKGQDTQGNVYSYPSQGIDTREAETWGPRVQRGGTFLAGKEYATTTFRLINLPELRLQDFGFRIVRKEGVTKDNAFGN